MPTSNLPRRPLYLATLRRLALPLLAVALAVAPVSAPAFADQPSHVILTRALSGSQQKLSVGLNKSMILDLPAEARQVIVSQPTIASALMQSKRRAVLQGISIGDTNIIFLDDKGAQIAALDVSVVRDDSTLTTAIAHLIPGSAISVQAFGDHIILSGTAQSQDDVAKAMAIAGQFAGGDANIANIITVAGSQQVNLKVTVAEVSRSAVKQLGIDLSGSLSSGVLTTGLASTEPLGGASNVVTGNAVTAALDVPGLSLKATLRALEQRGLMRTLDQPTLTAISGQPAEFLAGGEFPVPTAIDSSGNVSYAFKQFGVDLKFTPTVRSNGIVGLVIDTSVSEPTTDGAVTVGSLTIPALKNRQAKTTVELPVGSTLSIAGLYEDQERQLINSLPGVGNIPILGA
jgi:pilus assembly protein CpaC